MELKTWKITTTSIDNEGRTVRREFLVAETVRDRAIEALKIRRELDGRTTLEEMTEATPDLVDRCVNRPLALGEIFDLSTTVSDH